MPFGSLDGVGRKSICRFEVRGEAKEREGVRTSFEDLRGDIVEFGFELFKQRLDLFEIDHQCIHGFNRRVQTGSKNDRDVRKRSTRADLRYRSERGSWRRRAVSSRRSRLSLRPLESCWELERRGRLEELDPSWMNSRDNKTNKPVVADRRVFGAPYASLRPNPLLDCSNRYRQTRVRRPPQTWSGQDVLNDSGTVFILRGLALLGTVKVVCTFFGSLSVVEDS